MHLLMLVGLLLGSPPAGTVEAYPALADSAVVQGSAAALSEIRATLESRVESKRPQASTQDDRYLLAYVEWRLGQMLGPGAKK